MTLSVVSVIIAMLAVLVSVGLFIVAKRQASANERMVEEMVAQRQLQWRPYVMVRNIDEEDGGFWIQVVNAGRGPALTCAVIYPDPAGIFEAITHQTIPAGGHENYESLPHVAIPTKWMQAAVDGCVQRLSDKHYPFVTLCQDEFGTCLRFVEGVARPDEWHPDSQLLKPEWVHEGWTMDMSLGNVYQPSFIQVAPIDDADGNTEASS